MAHGFGACFSPILSAWERNLHDPAPLVIDVGCGSGIWGSIIKGFWPNAGVHGIEGLRSRNDPMPGCKTGPLDGAYDLVYYDQIQARFPTLATERNEPPTYDVGLCLDVIEHLPTEDGHNLLELMPRVALHWFVCTPAVLFCADAEGYDRHVSLWTEEDFLFRGFKLFKPRAITLGGVTGGREWEDFGWPMILAYRGPWDLANVSDYRITSYAQASHSAAHNAGGPHDEAV